MALLVRVERGNETIQRVGFAASPVRIGRNPLNEVFIEDPVVSQWHALVRFDETQRQITVMDLGSTNGTTHNGVMLQPHAPAVIGPNDVFSVGNLKFTLALANLPRELLEGGGRSNFDSNLAGGKATMMFSPDQAKTQMLSEGMAATMVMDPGSALPEAEPTSESIQDTLAAADDAVTKTRPAYKAYRDAWGEVARQLRARLEETPVEMRDQVVQALRAGLPQLNKEPEFAQMLKELGVSNPGGEEVDVADWLHRLKHGVGTDAHKEQINTRAAMERVGALLETFAESFISLRRGYEQFGEDMALQVAQEQSALTGAMDYRGVLQVLLDWNVDGARTVEDLKRSFADLAIHQVALLHGFVEGVRDLVQQVAPEALSTGQSSVAPQGGGVGSFPGRKGRLWKLYTRVHRSLLEEDRFTRVVFGRPFARAYFDVTGGMVQNAFARTEQAN